METRYSCTVTCFSTRLEVEATTSFVCIQVSFLSRIICAVEPTDILLLVPPRIFYISCTSSTSRLVPLEVHMPFLR